MSDSYPIFKWLHLSDIPFLGKNEYNINLIQSLPKYLRDLNEKYDCMVLSGDFHFAADGKMGIESIAQYVSTLLFATKLSKDKVVMAPGNQDLSRTDTLGDDIFNVIKDHKPTTGNFKVSCLNKLVKKFTSYNKLKTKISKNKNVITLKNNPHSIVDTGSSYILVLNTALCAYGNDEKDKGRIIIGVQYLIDLIKNVKDNPKPIIAIGHHGLDFLEEKERKEIARIFNKEGVMLYLCGHSHNTSSKKYDDNIVQIPVGCMQDNSSSNVDATFSIGQLYSDGKVHIIFHEWSNRYKQWIKQNTPPEYSKFEKLYNIDSECVLEPERRLINMTKYRFTISKVISNSEGVKYIWKKNGLIVESITINSKNKDSEEITSEYMISTSIGCLLQNTSYCKSCETGKNDVIISLKAEDIALQCIFMALYDILYCHGHPEVQKCKREFVFQIQGKQHLYPEAVNIAKKLTKLAMDKHDQKNPKYKDSTCCKIHALTFPDSDMQDAGDNTIRVFNAAVILLKEVKEIYEKTNGATQKQYSIYF